MKIDTKANTLKKLSTKIKYSIIPKSYIFTVNEWQNKNKFITKKIKQLFNGKNIIIRSSTTSEDTKNSSLAGAFESVLNIQVNNSKKINLSINQIINSYKSKILNVQSEQIFVQEMIQNIKMSGVIFTGDNFGYQDYYSINYDDITGRTDTVTSGSSEHSNKTLYIYKNKKNLIRSKRFKDLIKATEEIERHFLFPLDIEFCMTKKNKLYLLQVRPIVLQNNIIFSENVINKKLSIEFKKITKSFSKKIKGDLFGDYSFFSQMSDWNPAEMIGQFPSRLSHSLYSNLITDNSWIKAREAMGYKKIRDKKLMQNFAGRPFIDVRKSLNSFLPKNTPKVFGDKLINESITRLKFFPAIHDKIEFELIPTCFSFSIKEKLRKLKFNSNRILKFLENNFIQIFSQNLKNDSPGSIDYNLKKIQVLNLKQKESKYKLNFNLKNIIKILSETKKFGIVPFSILARHGFIAKDVLLSLKELKILNEKDIDNFMRSFSTITTEFLNDQTKLNKKKLLYKNFINKYGHLRAGTYDIKSANYRSLGKKVLLNQNISKIIKPPQFFISNIKKKKIQRLLSQKKINLSTDELFLYLENSIKAREYSKFIFSKSINIILEKIKLFSKAKNIKLNDIEHLTINEILKLQNISKKNIVKKISISKKNQLLNRRVKLPEIIVEKENAYIGASVVSTPNFVTDQNLTSKLLYLDNAAKQNLDNMIILLENADPGFDFIFSFKIKGLITKYGGVNSHMTIRCNELNIPAAIGCGDTIFTKLKEANKVNLNCKNYIIRIE
jgi:glutamine kinase